MTAVFFCQTECMSWNRAVEPEPGAEAILDGLSRSQKLLGGGTRGGAWNLGSGFTALACGSRKLYK